MKQRVIVIVGPTSSGKTAYSIDLAKKINGEVISADSRQVYKGLDIGTGKVTKKEMQGVRHHLLDVSSPKKVFTAHDFVKLGRKAIEEVLSRGKTPIICGGTGFYIDALVGRITLPEVPIDTVLRAQLEKRSAPELFTELKRLDAARARNIDRHNPVRLIRAIEIARALGRVPKNTDFVSPYIIDWIGLKPSDDVLKKKILDRLVARMKSGMVTEAKKLHAGGLSYKRMEQLGLEYRYLARFLQKKLSRQAMLSELEREIWLYARRQITYWRRNRDIKWISI
jgi:tRNA dimethylallyltransferase